MKLRLHNLGAGVSLGLFILLAAAMIRSLIAVDQFTWWDGQRQARIIISSNGMILAGRLTIAGGGSAGLPGFGGMVENTVRVRSGWAWQRDPQDSPALGAGTPVTAATPSSQYFPPTFMNLRLYRGFALTPLIPWPLWLLLLPTLLWPAAWVRMRWRERALARRGLCQACGYDLRGSPPCGDCPECGAARAMPA